MLASETRLVSRSQPAILFQLRLHKRPLCHTEVIAQRLHWQASMPVHIMYNIYIAACILCALEAVATNKFWKSLLNNYHITYIRYIG